MEKKVMMHTALTEGLVGRYAFLPGSPERSAKIARYFDGPREVAYNREYRTFVGTLNGETVSVTSTGIGGPSTAIAVEELHELGVDTMLRVGTCASTSDKVRKGDIVIANGAVRMEGLGNHYLPLEFPAVPDYGMLKLLEQATVKLGFPYTVGITITKASFSTQTHPERHPIAHELVERWQSYIDGGALTTSMEDAPLYLVAASLGIRAASVMVSATDYKQYDHQTSQNVHDIEDRAIRVGIEMMKQLIEQDKELHRKSAEN
ncbi:MAG: nucleoside phosphorylase [Clostridiales bacterium]|nr:nucleoside phosphorylase [Clostridiales bacterium]